MKAKELLGFYLFQFSPVAFSPTKEITNTTDFCPGHSSTVKLHFRKVGGGGKARQELLQTFPKSAFRLELAL